ncbi:Astrotactin-2 [Microtus ochrogaster]|uniref:Astrotactin-2 n=1 Tax=Microtus ochrogaster TaxID=79684 RepID=A0A8J6GRX1_MICOH|nr:Astrotactin-2 [Microtus ochrogaster]
MAAAGARRSPGPGLGLRGRPSLGFNPGPPPPPPPPLLLLFLLLLPPPLLLAGATAAASREPDSPCRLKTVTVSTLPALRESDIGWSGARAGAAAGTGAGAGAGAAASAAAASPGSAGSTGTAAESRLLLFVRNELPGRIAVQDDLDNTELPFFTLGKGRCHSRGVARNTEPLSDARLVGAPWGSPLQAAPSGYAKGSEGAPRAHRWLGRSVGQEVLERALWEPGGVPRIPQWGPGPPLRNPFLSSAPSIPDAGDTSRSACSDQKLSKIDPCPDAS